MTALVKKMQNGEDDEEMCPTIDLILDLTSKVRNATRTILATNSEISDELYDDCDGLVGKLSEKEDELSSSRRIFAKAIARQVGPTR